MPGLLFLSLRNRELFPKIVKHANGNYAQLGNAGLPMQKLPEGYVPRPSKQ